MQAIFPQVTGKGEAKGIGIHAPGFFGVMNGKHRTAVGLLMNLKNGGPAKAMFGQFVPCSFDYGAVIAAVSDDGE